MPITFDTVTFSVERGSRVADSYGGETTATSTVYAGLTAVLSYPSARSVRAGGEPPRSAAGPGGVTRTGAVLIIEPKPSNVSIQREDVISITGGHDWEVVGVRDLYEYTMQIDLLLIE